MYTPLENNHDQEQLIPEEIKEITRPQLIRATALNIFDEDQNHLKNHKALVNEKNHKQLFAIVTTIYKIIQHDEVVAAVEESLKQLNFNPNQKLRQLDAGARIRMYLSFPDTHIRVGEDTLSLRMFWENSYDTTTTLRLVVEGIILINGQEHSIFVNPKIYSRYNRRHTKGLVLDVYKHKIKHAVEVFLNEVKAEFEKMLSTPMDLAKAINFLDSCAEDKVIADIYLSAIRIELQRLQPDELDSQWILFNLINKVLNEKVKSLDAKEQHLKSIYDALSK